MSRDLEGNCINRGLQGMWRSRDMDETGRYRDLAGMWMSRKSGIWIEIG